MSGPTFVGAYEILSVLGRGGMGVVYEARRPDMARTVALKQVTSQAGTARQRFEREGELLARVRHPNVVRVHEFGNAPEGPFLVTERVDGEALSDVYARKPLDPTRAAVVVRDLAGAVAALHAVGVVHRDLKPENVIVRSADEAPILIDFGLAFSAEQERLTQTGGLVGTPQFMAPEQMGGGEFDERVDVYALGAILYTLLSGDPPFWDVDSAHSLMVAVASKAPDWSLIAHVPRPLLTIVMRCMAKQPDGRYPSAAALEADLSRFVAGEPISGAPPATSRVGFVLGAIAALSLVVGAVLAASPRATPRVVKAPSATPTPVANSTPRAAASPAVEHWVHAKTLDLGHSILSRGSAAFVGDGRVVVSAEGTRAFVWDPESDARVELGYPQRVSGIRTLCVTPERNGTQTVVLLVDEGLVVGALPPATFTPRLIEVPGLARRLTLFKGGQEALVGADSGRIHRIDLERGVDVGSIAHSEHTAVGALLVMGETVFSTSGAAHGNGLDFTLRRWKASDLSPGGDVAPLHGSSRGLAGLPDGSAVVVGTNAGRLLAISARGEPDVRAFESKDIAPEAWVKAPFAGGSDMAVAHETEVRAVAVSRDGSLVYSLSTGIREQASSMLRVWRFPGGEPVGFRALDGHSGTCLQLSADGRQLLIGAWGGHFELWSARD